MQLIGHKKSTLERQSLSEVKMNGRSTICKNCVHKLWINFRIIFLRLWIFHHLQNIISSKYSENLETSETFRPSGKEDPGVFYQTGTGQRSSARGPAAGLLSPRCLQMLLEEEGMLHSWKHGADFNETCCCHQIPEFMFLMNSCDKGVGLLDLLQRNTNFFRSWNKEKVVLQSMNQIKFYLYGTFHT